MSCVGKVVLSAAILAVCLQAAPVAKRQVSSKLIQASCPQAKTGKYLVILEFPQPGSSEQKVAPSFHFEVYMDKHLVKEDEQVKEEQPTKADILNQVSTDEPNATSPPTEVSNGNDDGEEDKTAEVKSYSMVMPELIYHVDMNNPALQDVLKMSGVAIVEEETTVFGANCGGGFGGFGNQDGNEPDPSEGGEDEQDGGSGESEDGDSQQPMMMMLG